MSSVTSTASPGRLLAPDLARGFMLLLIAMAYASVYVGEAFGEHATHEPWWDQTAVIFSTLVLDNRAFPMFALLFGYGVAWSVRRRSERGASETSQRRRLRRRGWLLLAIGAVHATLVYPGEILTSYGLALLLTGWLLFRSNRALKIAAWCAAIFYLVTVPVAQLLYVYSRGIGDIEPVAGYTTLGDWITRIASAPVSLLYLAVAYPLFLLVILGYLAGRARLIEEPQRHRRLFIRLAVLGVSVSVLAALPSALIFIGVLEVDWPVEGLAMGLQVLTGMFGGAGYIALFVLFADRLQRVAGRLVTAVAALGRRSLTFYLLVSVLVAVALHPDLVGLSVGALGALSIGLVAWLVALALATWLERLDKPGPMELFMRRIVDRGTQRT